MTIYDLFLILKEAVNDGHGDGPVYFDTEAQNYDYHLASVDKACTNLSFDIEGRAIMTLHENSPHRSK